MKRLFLFCMAILLPSCGVDFFTPVVEIDIEVPSSRLVLISNFQEGSSNLNVYLSRTRPILDNSKYPVVSVDTIFFIPNDRTRFRINTYISGDTVSNARIDLYKNNVFLTSFVPKDQVKSYYKASLSTPLTYEANTTYTIKASAPGFESIEATSSMPRAVLIENMTYRAKVPVAVPNEPLNTDLFNEFTLNFTDPLGEKNFYAASGIFKDTLLKREDMIHLISYDFKSIDDYLSDESFDGKKSSWNVHEYAINNTLQKYPTAEFTLHSLNESLYLYRLSITRYSRAQDDPFSEPVILYTNVKNGFGVFSMSASRSYLLKLK